MTDSLTAFLKARIDEDEQAARAAGEVNPPPWENDHGWVVGQETPRGLSVPWHGSLDGGLWDNEGASSLSMAPVTAEHIARHDPARVLAEVEAKRRLIDLHWEDASEQPHPLCDHCGFYSPCPTLRLLALPHASHADYRQEWALRARDEAAVAAYRATGERQHLDLLNQDGLPDLVHDLVMEYALLAGGGRAAPYTARVDAWLRPGKETP